MNNIFRETSADTERIKYNTNGIKTASSKTLIFSKSREGTAESSGTTRFSNTSADVQYIIVTNARNGKLLQANMRNKIRQKKLYSVVVCSKFLVRTLHMNHGRFQCLI